MAAANMLAASNGNPRDAGLGGRRTTISLLSMMVRLLVGVLVATASQARADSSACNDGFADVTGEVLYKGNGRDVNYPAKLHGKTVRLINGRFFNQSFATADDPSPGDILSIDRATDSDKRNTKQKWWFTSQIHNWEYCQETSAGRLSACGNKVCWRTPTMNNWHVPMRVCLRHNSALQCTNVWYADQS